MRHAGCLLLLLSCTSHALAQGADPRRQLTDYLLEHCKEHFTARRKEVASLKNADDIRQRQETLKAKFLESLGGFPEKSPLNAKVVGSLQGDGFRVEKVIYESRPNHHVTANLYLPNTKAAVPGVIVPCGHSPNGKAADAYQRACIVMAKHGIAVLCYDPIGQGERLQLLKDDGKPGISSSTNEHTLIGIGAWLVGQSTATYRIWDGIRSLDYLASRPEVDAKKLGCAGNSGGGTLTAYLMALDDRILAAVPSCYLTTLEKLFATIGPQDAEQNIVGQVAFGMEHADFLTLRAPRPTLMAVATQDFFNIDGAWTTFREASLIYSKMGHAERVALVEYDDKHGFSKPRREATARWMRRWLLGIDDAVVEDQAKVFKDSDLQCTRSGQVLTDLKGVSAFQLNAATSDQFKKDRDAFTQLPIGKQRALVRRGIGLADKITAAKMQRRGAEVAFEVAPGLILTAKHHAGGKTGRVLVLPENRVADKVDPLAKRFVEQGHDVLELDLRGLGGLPASSKPAFFSHDFRPSMLGLHLNRPLLGQRVEDVLAVLAAWEGEGNVHLVAQGVTGPVALHAALLEPRIEAVTLEKSIVSWDNVVRTPMSYNQLANVVPGVLRRYDLPQLAAALAPRPLTLSNSVDAALKSVAAEDVRTMYGPCRDAYERQSAGKNFRFNP